MTFATPVIKSSRSGWNVNDATFMIDCHSGPVIRSPDVDVQMGIGWPRLITFFPGTGYRFENPFKFSRPDIERLNVAEGGIIIFRNTQWHNDEIFKYGSWGI